MQIDNKLLDDLARMAGGAMGAVAGVRGEVEQHFRQQLERLLVGMDLVHRDEFDTLKDMVAAARAQETAMADLRQQQAALLERVAHLESLVAGAAARADAAPKPGEG